MDLAIAGREGSAGGLAAVETPVRAEEDRRDCGADMVAPDAWLRLRRRCSDRSRSPGRVRVRLDRRGRLVEVEAGIGVEGEVVLRRAAGRGGGRRGSGQAEVGEDGVDGFCGGDEGEDAHVAAAAGAGEGEYLVDAGEEASPAGAGGGALRGVRQGGGVGACRGRRSTNASTEDARARGEASRGRAAIREALMTGEISETTLLRTAVAEALRDAEVDALRRVLDALGVVDPTRLEEPADAAQGFDQRRQYTARRTTTFRTRRFATAHA
jgi:hypothetical protein